MIQTVDLVRRLLSWAESLRKTKDWKNEDEEAFIKIKYRIMSYDGLIKAGDEFKTALEATLFFEDNDE